MGKIQDHRKAWAKDGAKRASKPTVLAENEGQTSKNDELQSDPLEDTNKKYKLLKQAVRMDMEKLKEIEDHAARIPLKNKLLDKYRPYLKEFIEKEESHQNEVLYLNMIWAADCKQWDWMIELAEYAHKIGQKPVKPWFNSKPYTAVADPLHNIEDKAYTPVKERKEGDTAITEFSEGANRIFQKIQSGDWDIHPITKARYYRLFGIKFYEEDKNYKLALELLKEGTEIKDDLGVKTRIKDLELLLTPEPETENKPELDVTSDQESED